MSIISTSKKYVLLLAMLCSVLSSLSAQHSIARLWSEALLGAIRKDFARPTVHARNLFHTSIAMYDAWAAYDTVAQTYFLGKTVGGFSCPFEGVPTPANLQAAREEAISYACYRLLRHRFQTSPGAATSLPSFATLMASRGYNINFTSTNYQSGSPAALGNYLAAQLIQFGLQDGSNEQNSYANQYYSPVNPSLVIDLPGNPDLADPNHWQPLTLDVFIDQSGNVIPFNTPPFLSPEWGNVVPFAMTDDDRTGYQRDGDQYWVYNDPGAPPTLDTIDGGGRSAEFIWNFALVAAWGAHLDPDDGVMWDISPSAYGRPDSLPDNFEEYMAFYDLLEGGTQGNGHPVNPRTGLPYPPQMVRRGDYARILAEFWADGPESETPPGHWFTILNYINDHPDLVKRFKGTGPVLADLEWDVKTYLMMGGAMHDAAISAWSIKGWYDYIRPVSAIRGMAEYGQSSNPALPSFHPAGLPLIPGRIELVMAGDPLAGPGNIHVGKIKLYTWKGPNYVNNPVTDVAGVDWILAEEWWPYQRPSFVTPPFAGYISGHSTYSRTAAELLTTLTNDPFFPGGVGEFPIPANTFLKFERGPSAPMVLQWATYRDASDQSSLSRIWGGIHPPVDDIPGRKIGGRVAEKAFNLAQELFYRDADGDGFFSYEDCDDRPTTGAAVYPGAPEICDGRDNNCDGSIDENLPLFTYYRDADADGFGTPGQSLDTCLMVPPAGYVANASDCDDQDATFSPNAAEVCDGFDNNCDGSIDENLPLFTYYRDADGDSFGNAAQSIDTCRNTAPVGYVTNSLDCNDANSDIRPNATEVCDGIDNDCDGQTDEGVLTTYFQDADADGSGNPNAVLLACTQPMGYVTNNADCNDSNPLEKPGQLWYADNDNDGYSNGNVTTQCLRPNGYKLSTELISTSGDCQDGVAAINPAAAEVCDDIDNNCNGTINEGLVYARYYRDADADDYGDLQAPLDTCLALAPLGFVADSTDCDDTQASINPGATETADNRIDEDCNGSDLFLLQKVFPNPVVDFLRVHLQHDGPAEVYIYNLSGQLVRRSEVAFAFNTAEVDFRFLPHSVYWLRLQAIDGTILLEAKILK